MKPKINWEKIFENLPVKILALTAALLLFLFHRIDILDQKEFTLPVELVLDPGYIPLEYPSLRSKVLLRGPRSSLGSFQADDLQVQADLSAVTSEGPVRVPLTVRRSGLSAELPDVEIIVEPLELLLEMEKKASKILEVQPQLTGTPAAEYEISSVEVLPSKVTALGPRSRIAQLKTALTDKIDIIGLSEEVLRDVKLLTPDPTVSFLTGPSVRVKVGIQALVSLREFSLITPRIVNLSSNLRLIKPPGQVNFILSGPKAQLRASENIKAEPFIDLTSIQEPGVYELPVGMETPEGFSVSGLEPQRLLIYLEGK